MGHVAVAGSGLIDTDLPIRVGPKVELVLCAEPCGLRGLCRLGIVVERLDREDSAYFEIECPADHRESPDLAHGAWTAAVLSEMCGVLPILLGTIAYMGTVTVRFQAPVPMGE
jgi:hypothetical protein